MKKSYYFELFQPESLDELPTFHQDTFRLIHNHSEPYNNPISNARYRSWVGLSYPSLPGLINITLKNFVLINR